MPAGVNQDLVTFLGVDESDVVKGVKNANKELDKFAVKAAKTVTKVGRSFQGLGKSLTLAVTVPLTALSGSLVKTASDAEETAQKFGVVFSGVADAANAATKDIASGFGLAQDQTQSLLANTGDLLTGFGFTQEAALDLSIQTNKLAADLASFTNLEGGTTRASEALTKALLGERESVKSLGIAILEVDVKEQVLLNTQEGLTFETMRQAKAYATLQLALGQSQNAIGDFQRSINSTANQTKIFLANLRDLRVDIGKRLIPVFRQILGFANDLVMRFSALSDATKQDVIQVAALAAALGPVLFIGGTVLVFLGTFASAMTTAAAAVGTFGLAIATTFGGLALTIAAPIALIAGGVAVIGLLFANLIGFRKTAELVFTDLTKIWTKTANFFSEFVEFMTGENKDLSESTKTAVTFIGSAWIGLKISFTGVSSIFAGFVKNMLRDIGNLVHGFAQAKQDIANTIFSIRDNIAKTPFGALFDFDFVKPESGQVGKTLIETGIDVVISQIDKDIAALDKKSKELVFSVLDVPAAIKKDADKFTEAFNVVLAAIEEVPLVGRVKEIVAEVKAAFASLGLLGAEEGGVAGGGVGGGGIEGAGGVGGGGFMAAFNAALEQNKMTMEDWGQFAVDTIGSVASAFTDGFKGILNGEKQFGKALIGVFDGVSNMMLDIAFKSIFARISMRGTETAANAAAAAPHPFLIPTFIGIAAAAFGAMLSGSGFEGAGIGSSGSGGTPAAPPPMASATVVEGEDVDDEVSGQGGVMTIVVETEFGDELLKWQVDATVNGKGNGTRKFVTTNA